MRIFFKKIVDKLFNLMLFIFVRPVKFNQADYERIIKERELIQNTNTESKVELYRTKQTVKITNSIIVETFESDSDFYRVITPYDALFARTKNDIIKKLNEGIDYHYNIGAYYCILNGITIQSMKESIIEQIEKLDDFKWIRISYLQDLNNLTEYEKQEFENMKFRGFPTF